MRNQVGISVDDEVTCRMNSKTLNRNFVIIIHDCERFIYVFSKIPRSLLVLAT